MDKKQRAIETLKAIYDQYRGKGLEAVYLWGSMARGEFDVTSDVDSIGVVTKDSEITEADFQPDLAGAGIGEFHLRLISIEELKTGEPDKNHIITHFIAPTVLLFDLPDWEQVAGKKFKVTDFRPTPPTVSEVMGERVRRILKDDWTEVAKVKPEEVVYYLKELLRLVHLKQVDRGMITPFSISSINKNANGQEKQIIAIFKELKASEYDHKKLIGYQEILDAFVREIVARSL